MEIKVEMHINSEKKHSVRYDALDKEASIQSIYIMKHSIPNPTPKIIITTIKFGED